MIDHENCRGCNASPATAHGEDCDHARCPDCGQQLMWHECQYWPLGVDGPDRPALWHGVDPYDEIAQEQDWWTTPPVGIDHLVEDIPRVLAAIKKGRIVWDSQAQRYHG